MHDVLSDHFECILTGSEKANLREQRFVNRELIGMDLSGADLRGAWFERTVLARCNLAGADLRGARFISCEIRDVLLSDAVLGDNRFDGTTLADAVGLAAATRSHIEEVGGTFQPAFASPR